MAESLVKSLQKGISKEIRDDFFSAGFDEVRGAGAEAEGRVEILRHDTRIDALNPDG